jgi:transcriptional regulator with XRE-family HTH domain
VRAHPDGRRYIVIDGLHRLQAYRRAGRKTVSVQVLDEAGFWEAFVANRDHGLPLSVDDRKHAAVWLKRKDPNLSVREIAKKVGLSPSTVQAALQGDRRREAGGGVVRSTNPWRAFFVALVGLYERHMDYPDRFVEGLARDLADLVERSQNPGLLWDALAAFAEAIERGLQITDHLYEENENETAGEESPA